MQKLLSAARHPWRNVAAADPRLSILVKGVGVAYVRKLRSSIEAFKPLGDRPQSTIYSSRDRAALIKLGLCPRCLERVRYDRKAPRKGVRASLKRPSKNGDLIAMELQAMYEALRRVYRSQDWCRRKPQLLISSVRARVPTEGREAAGLRAERPELGGLVLYARE